MVAVVCPTPPQVLALAAPFTSSSSSSRSSDAVKTSPSTRPPMGLHRRKTNQLTEAEAKATQEIAADHSRTPARQQPQQPQPRSPLVSYLITVGLAICFWLVYQQLHKHSLHLAKGT